MTNGTHDHGQWWDSGSIDALDLLEIQMAVLARNLELLSRRGAYYGQLDKAAYLLLRTLEANGSTDIVTLAAELGLDPSTVGRQVTALRGDGLVKRTADRHDRRRSIVSPTPEGLEQLAHTREQRSKRTAELLDGWSDEDRWTFGVMLLRLNRSVAHNYLTPPSTDTTTDQDRDKG